MSDLATPSDIIAKQRERIHQQLLVVQILKSGSDNDLLNDARMQLSIMVAHLDHMLARAARRANNRLN
jgi:hypothetical protein